MFSGDASQGVGGRGGEAAAEQVMRPTCRVGYGKHKVLLAAIGVPQTTGKEGGHERWRLRWHSWWASFDLIEVRIVQEREKERESRGGPEGQVAGEREDGCAKSIPAGRVREIVPMS